MADEYNRCVGGGGGGSNCNWWDPSPTTRRTTPTFSSSIVDSTATTSSSVDTFSDHHSLHMMSLGLSSHQPILHHYPPLLRKGDGGFRSIIEEGMVYSSSSPAQKAFPTDVEPTREFNSIKGSSPSMFSHSSSSVDSSSHGLPSPTFLTPLESSGIYQGHMMPASSPNDHHNNNSGYGYHQPMATGGGMPMSNYNSDDVIMGMNWTTSSNKDQFPQFLKSSSMVEVVPKPIQPQLMNINSHGSFWNGVAAPMADPRPAEFFPVAPPQMAMPSFGDKRKHNMEVRSTSGAGRKSTTGSDQTSTTSTTTTGGATAKRPRNEASSNALPPFKVRKEKMGDRITALQQLVSPFGKTDTASVLSEAIEYIKFLHEQVNGLSTPYLKSGASLQQQQQRNHDKFKDQDEGARQDLRSRGLCLVPVSSTFPVAHETAVDFWTPTFGPAGAFR